MLATSAVAMLLICGGAGPIGAQGYVIGSDRLTVSGPDHWEDWEGAIGGHTVGAEGVVRPRFLRRSINAVLNATTFETIAGRGDTVIGGVRNVGISPETAPLVMDGDLTTYWEPGEPDSLLNWFVEMDLGRGVIADRVVVRFADEGEGDPFLKFRVLASTGRKPKLASRYDREFYRVGQVTNRNKTQRVFEFDVPTQRPLPPGVTGEVVQLVRLEALDTDGPRGEEVSEEEYGALSPADKGAIEHFRVTVAGREIQVAEDTYVELPPEEQGPIRFYRHERPKVAEVEVLALGDNVVGLTQRIRNRDTDLFENILLNTSSDGQFSSFYDIRVYDPLQNRNQLLVDLKAKFWLDRIRLLSAKDAMTAYQVRISDGSLDPTGDLIWTTFEERHNRDSFLQLEEQFPLQEVQLIELRRLELLGSRNEQANLSELQAYGEGYVSEVNLSSPLIKLGSSRIITGVEWEGDAPEGTRLEVRTRSGNGTTLVPHYFDLLGREISKQQWEASTSRDNRWFVTKDTLPGPGWSNWSEPYIEQGELFKSPNPRRMAMVQVRLLTSDPAKAASVRRLQLGLAVPLVDESFAEVWPNRGVRPGIEEEFAIYVRPAFRAGDDGFDRLRIRSSSVAPMELVSLRSGTAAQLQREGGRRLWPGRVEAESLEEGGIEMVFPERVSGGIVVYEARVRTKVFLSGTTFTAELLNSARPEVVQLVSAGDASDQVGSELMVVVADVEDASVLQGVRAMPQVFTPNGDGINDETSIGFSVFRVKGEQTLRVGVYDLTGRRLRDLSVARENPSGEHDIAWDGKGEDGSLVPPGSYLVRVGVHTDADVGGGGEGLAVVGVAY